MNWLNSDGHPQAIHKYSLHFFRYDIIINSYLEMNKQKQTLRKAYLLNLRT